ncbi:MAG: substrate-binding domain-containing protein [Lachnospiraceae bacterium]|nr:substrate-binding domain-containing protein [Lachnospiraceae bacterium]
MDKRKLVITDIMPDSIQPYMYSSGIYNSLTNDSTSKNITKSEQINENTINPDKHFTFGWSVFDASLEFWSIMQEGVLSKAKELGIDVIKHDEKSDSIEMITGSIDLIKKGVNALLIAPYNPEGLPFIVAEADKNQIPVVVLDIGTGGANVAVFIVSDSFGGGIYAGEYALNLIKKYSIESTNVAIIKVQETAKFALLRGLGFKGVMIENGYTVVAEVTANSVQSQGYEAMKNILATYADDLAVVFCENGPMTLGAAQALDEAGKKGEIMLIGFDSGPSIIAGIKNGSIQGTIAQEPFLMGEVSVEVANSLLLGIPVTYDDNKEKTILMEVYLIDESGEALRSIG